MLLLPHETLRFPQHELRLVALVVCIHEHEGRAAGILGPKLLLDPALVGSYYSAGSVEDRLGRAVVLLQYDDLGLGEVGLEALQVADVRAAPRVDRLVGVAYYAQVAVKLADLPGDGILGDVGVLKLVDHEVYVALLVAPCDLRHVPEQGVDLDQQVVEVQRRVGMEHLLIPLVGAVDYLVPVAALPGGERVHAD